MTLGLGSRFESDFRSERHVQYRSEAETKTKKARQASTKSRYGRNSSIRGPDERGI
jgi:hypothetical protein